MKITHLLIAAIAAFTLHSCSESSVPEKDPEKGVSGKAYMNLTLVGTKAPTRVDPGNGGNTEDAVNDIHMLFFDKDNLYLGSLSVTDISSIFTINSQAYETTNPIQVPGATAKLFVIINNFKANTNNARFTLPTKNDSIVARPWSTLNSTLSYTTAGDDVNAFIIDYTDKRNNKDNFVMANYGVRYNSGTTDVNPNDNGLVEIKTGKTAAEAQANTNTVTIDRLASKVKFVATFKGDGSTKEVAANPTDAKFFLQGWEMNATNRYMRLYSEHDANYTQGNGTAGVLVAYRKDANYLTSSYGADLTKWDEYKKQFIYLQNIGIDGNVNVSAVGWQSGDVKYCPENTMSKEAQLVGATTKVTIKGNYVPAGYAANASYFTYKGEYYTLDKIQLAYTESVTAGGHTQGLAKDMDAFILAAGFVTGTPTDAEYATAVAALGVTHVLDAKTGIKAREKNAVRYFHEGVNYYSILIRHDSREGNNMALGRYGVVRNNMYNITLNSVSRPGTPWIPGGPDDPTTDPSTPDDNTALLDVTIEINPWVSWNQIVDL